MQKSEIDQVITQVLAEIGKPVQGELRAEQSLRQDLGFDSLGLAALTVHIEDRFSVDIFANGLISTVGEIYSKVGLS